MIAQNRSVPRSQSTAYPAALEPAWQPLLASVSPRSVSDAALSLMVARLSRKYRGEAVTLAHADELTARARFWLPRDLGKVARAVQELSLARALPARPLRVLDLGAGLGASSLGALRALPEGHSVAHITAVDRDPEALAMMVKIAQNGYSKGLFRSLPEIVTACADYTDRGRMGPLGVFDLVLLGLSLVELTRGLGDEVTRGEAMARTLHASLSSLADDGALVLIEPADRDCARPLGRARDALIARGVTVFSPCLHSMPCPMLERPRDWCHEDLADVSLPDWLVSVARAAGLRYEGLTYSYLVLRHDGITLASRIARESMLSARLISAPLRSKGKTEAVLCGPLAASVSMARVRELHREVQRGEASLDALPRGALVHLREALTEGVTQGESFRVSPGDLGAV